MPKLPGVNHLDVVRALEKAGFWIARQGKYIVMMDGNGIVTIPDTIRSIRSRWAGSFEMQSWPAKGFKYPFTGSREKIFLKR